MNRQIIFSTFIIILLHWGCANKKDEQTTDARPAYQTRFITVADSVKVEVLDWGGKGQPLVFLTGLGNTAHVFDKFAPKFADQYHVYALTRRGFGQSSIPKTGYDMATLAHDVRVVLDSLHIQKALLVGHSIAGDEMSLFASTYPDRVAKLVYLEAAYDRSNLMKLLATQPGQPMPTAVDSASRTNFDRYLKEVVGVQIPAAEIKETAVFSKEGRFVRETTPGFVYGAIIMGLKRPDYRHVTCPALAIYAHHTTLSEATPFYTRLDAADRKRAMAGFPALQAWATKQPTLFKEEVVQGTTHLIEGANHYMFISHPTETEKLMREFLK